MDIESKVITYADGSGRWHAIVPSTIDAPDKAAREAILKELAARERATRETLDQAITRIKVYLHAIGGPIQIDGLRGPGGQHYVEYLMSTETKGH